MGKQDDHPSVKCFNLLFQYCTEGTIYLHFLPSEKKLFVPVMEINSIPEILEKHKEESCYFGLATRKDGDSSKGGIIKIPALCVEIGSKVPFKKMEDLLERFPLKPTCWIKHRSGYHICFLLKKPAGPPMVQQVENLNKRLAIYFMGDPDRCDAGRTFHIPGTLELGKKPEVYFYRVHPDRQYSIHDFDKNLPALPMTSSVGTSPPPAGKREKVKGVPAEVKPKSKPSEEEKWADYVKRTKEWNTLIPMSLLHSEAYKKLDYAPALKVLNWFYEKRQSRRIKGKRGKDRFQVVNDGNISFPYREAILRGLTSQQFRKALKGLHGLGFIDIKKPGSALRGDWTIFGLSDRWKEYGTSNFKDSEFPKSVHWVNFGWLKKKKS